MFILVFAEWGWSIYRHRDAYDGKDFLAATTIGLVNVGISALLKVVVFGAALFFWNLVPWKIPPTWWSFIPCFILLALARYLAPRLTHDNLFWWSTLSTPHNAKKKHF